MSGSAPDGAADGQALRRLEGLVEEAASTLTDLRDRLRASEARAEELGDLVRRIGDGELQPAELLARVRELETENADLRQRIETGRSGVQRLLAKVRFLEEQA